MILWIKSNNKYAQSACFNPKRGGTMTKALSYMMIGALGSGAVILYMQNRRNINRTMHKIKQDGMRKLHKIKAAIE